MIAYKESENMNKKIYYISINGVYMAMAVALLFFATIMPGIEMSIYALAGLVLGLVILETGIKSGMFHYAGTLILSFIIIPNKVAILPYATFFGIYGFVKFYIEKIKSALWQLILKVCFFIIMFSTIFLGFKEVLFANVELPDISKGLLFIGGLIMFVLYDYIYTLGMNLYLKRIKRNKVRFKLSGKKDKDE